LGNQVSAGFEIRKDEIFVPAFRVEAGAREALQQFAKIDFGSADAAGDQVKSVDADPAHPVNASLSVSKACRHACRHGTLKRAPRGIVLCRWIIVASPA
jgi:hypothetical protein